jgi:hypothetical protein
MNCDQLREHFELHALGLLEDSEEKRAIEEHLARGCESCERRRKDALVIQAFLLSQAPDVVPPARLKRRVMAAIGVQRAGWTWLAALAASLMLVVALWFSLESRSLQVDQAAVRSSLAEVNAERERLEQAFRFLEAPQTRQVTFGQPQAAPPRGSVYVNPQLGVLLIATNLPRLNPGQAYEMWLIPPGANATPRPAGLFQAAETGAALHTFPGALDLSEIAAVAVTIEPAAGSPAPTSMPLFAARVGG